MVKFTELVLPSITVWIYFPEVKALGGITMQKYIIEMPFFENIIKRSSVMLTFTNCFADMTSCRSDVKINIFIHNPRVWS